VVSAALADALREAQAKAGALGYGLLVWDGYRPQRAVNRFLDWAAQPEDGGTKANFYPRLERSEMISRGYIAAKSGHSRGSAVDLTLYRFDTGVLLPMGTCFDFMDERSHHTSNAVSAMEAENRRLLCTIMVGSGFEAFVYEWWHYVLKDEPHPTTYFDFPIAKAALSGFDSQWEE
jgi:D-alanyl-D-alanine dipeptidase